MQLKDRLTFLKRKINIFHNIWLKLTALILAVLTWFYVTGEFSKTALVEETQSMAHPFKIVSKALPIQPVFIGNPPAGYELNMKEVTVEPNTYNILGFSMIIDKVHILKTEAMDISEYTRPFTAKVRIQRIIGIRLPAENFVTVKVKIQKQEAKEGN